MKKILSVLLAVLLLASISVAAYAENFVNSVENAGAPEIDAVADSEGNDVSALIKIVPYEQVDTLAEDDQTAMHAAYDSLNAGKLADINADLAAAAGDKSIAVSDFFFLTSDEDVSFPLKVTLRNSNLADFVSLLQYVDGAWTWIDAEVDGDALTFSIESFGPFSIIVAGEPAASAPTGEATPVVFIAGAVVLAAAAAWFFMKSRKVEA